MWKPWRFTLFDSGRKNQVFQAQQFCTKVLLFYFQAILLKTKYKRLTFRDNFFEILSHFMVINWLRLFLVISILAVGSHLYFGHFYGLTHERYSEFNTDQGLYNTVEVVKVFKKKYSLLYPADWENFCKFRISLPPTREIFEWGGPVDPHWFFNKFLPDLTYVFNAFSDSNFIKQLYLLDRFCYTFVPFVFFLYLHSYAQFRFGFLSLEIIFISLFTLPFPTQKSQMRSTITYFFMEIRSADTQFFGKPEMAFKHFETYLIDCQGREVEIISKKIASRRWWLLFTYKKSGRLFFF